MSQFRAACIQNTATRDIAANVEWVCLRIDEAVAAGADFTALAQSDSLEITTTTMFLDEAMFIQGIGINTKDGR